MYLCLVSSYPSYDLYDAYNDYDYTSLNLLCEQEHEISSSKLFIGLRDFFAPSQKGNFRGFQKRECLNSKARHQFLNIQRNHVCLDIRFGGSVERWWNHGLEIKLRSPARCVGRKRATKSWPI